MVNVVYVWGPAFCGSTIFGTTLGSHSNTRTFGELQKFVNDADPLDKDDPWVKKILDRVGQDSELYTHEIHSVILDLIDEDILIDISKSQMNWEGLYDNTLEYKHIILFRELPGNIYSHLKHQTQYDITKLPVNSSIKQRIDDLLLVIKNRYQYVDEKINGHKQSLHYKFFAQKTKQALKGICNYVGIDFQAKMLKPWEHEHRIFGGSRSIRYFLEEDHPYRDELPEFEKQYYKKPKIEYNDAWRKFIPPELVRFIHNNQHTKVIKEVVNKYA